jgi:hypothetical protein
MGYLHAAHPCAGRVLKAKSTSATPNARLVLPVVLAGTFMVILDVAIVNVAIPAIPKDLRSSYPSCEMAAVLSDRPVRHSQGA